MPSKESYNYQKHENVAAKMLELTMDEFAQLKMSYLHPTEKRKQDPDEFRAAALARVLTRIDRQVVNNAIRNYLFTTGQKEVSLE